MDNSSKYFYASGVFSFVLFFLFFFLFAYTLFDTQRTKTYALNKDTFISISLEMPKKTFSKPAEKKMSAPAAVEPISDTKNIDVNDLFSDVWTKKIEKKQPKEVNSKRIMEIGKKLKTVESNSVEELEKLSKTQELSDANKEQSAVSTAQEVNEYLAKIQAIVYQHFYVPANTQGHSVKSVIELNALGKMLDFRILNYSQSSALNAEVDKIKERLKNVVFPVNPQNSSSRTVVILISKE